jgi:hypothetical protein
MTGAQASVPNDTYNYETTPHRAEFRRIILEFVMLKDRMSIIGQNAVRIRDQLIGVRIDDEMDDNKRDKPECFTAECFDLINCFKWEIEQLEKINSQLLSQIDDDGIGEAQ